MSDAKITAADLREAMVRAFKPDELVIVCHDVDINPDEVPNRNAGITVWVGELLAYSERVGRLQALIDACAKHRPHIDWATLLQARGNAKPTPIDAIGARVTQFIGLLSMLMQDPKAREVILLFRYDLLGANEHIATLNNYKQLHDLFQELELHYTPIDADSRRAAADPGVWDTLAEHLAEAQGIITDLESATVKAGLAPEEAPWLRQLAPVKHDLQRALDGPSAEPIGPALAVIQRSLSRDPTRLNTRMVEVVKVLLKTGLIRQMESLRESLVNQNVANLNLDDYLAGLIGLAELREKLQQLAARHNEWQIIDDELNRIDNSIARDIGELEQGWGYVADMARPLIDGNSAEWAVSLQRIGGDLQLALQEKTTSRARSLFSQYRSKASRHFRRVDDELLEVCNQLEKIGIDLSGLLNRM